ncbi:MAG TPA: response regulator [Candidatus Aminicenantes bacterium]|nr:response regulator [Candidatus Aminicenantes bacterium]
MFVGQPLLETLGYTVFLAKSGSETYERLKEISSDIKVLLSSGYSINGLAKTILTKGGDGFIQKPFIVKDLSQKLREILNKE